MAQHFLSEIDNRQSHQERPDYVHSQNANRKATLRTEQGDSHAIAGCSADGTAKSDLEHSWYHGRVICFHCKESTVALVPQLGEVIHTLLEITFKPAIYRQVIDTAFHPIGEVVGTAKPVFCVMVIGVPITIPDILH